MPGVHFETIFQIRYKYFVFRVFYLLCMHRHLLKKVFLAMGATTAASLFSASMWPSAHPGIDIQICIISLFPCTSSSPLEQLGSAG